MRADVVLRWALAGGVLALMLLSAGCGGGAGEAIKIAYVWDCTSPLSEYHEQAVAGAELPLIQRGATLKGPKPSNGVAGGSIAGRRVELLLGCEFYGDFVSLLTEVRHLVEDEGADIIVGPSNEGEGLVLKEYARRHPNVTFSMAAALEQPTTLKDSLPNVFRFNLDVPQLSAGLGSYAYHALGWRNAVTVGEDDPAGWSEVAGFVAEFCALGGNIVDRLWTGFPKDFTTVVGEIPSSGVDGVVFPSQLQDAQSFMAAWGRRHPDLGRNLLVGSVPLYGPLTDQMLGLVGASNWPWTPTAAWRRYSTDFARVFPSMQSSFFSTWSYDAMEPVLEALERVHGDLSHGQRALQRALGRLTFNAPNGVTRLDGRRQAIAPMYLGRVERDAHGELVVRQIRIVPNVEQTFGGYFGPSTPPPSRTQPACRHGNPPRWAKWRAGSTK